MLGELVDWVDDTPPDVVDDCVDEIPLDAVELTKPLLLGSPVGSQSSVSVGAELVAEVVEELPIDAEDVKN